MSNVVSFLSRIFNLYFVDDAERPIGVEARVDGPGRVIGPVVAVGSEEMAAFLLQGIHATSMVQLEKGLVLHQEINLLGHEPKVGGRVVDPDRVLRRARPDNVSAVSTLEKKHKKYLQKRKLIEKEVTFSGRQS